MSVTFIERKVVHYEVFGRGQPVIFLHSWLGSWRYWVPSMEMISDRFRAYAMDFWGFGDSDGSVDEFTLDTYVEQLLGFMRELGMVKANLVGHGLGGMVAVRAAMQSPNSFLKLIVTGMPVQGQVLANLTKGGALSRLMGRNSASEVMNKLMKQIQPKIADQEILAELLEDINNVDPDVLQEVFDSLVETDLRADLERLATPTLALYGGNDLLIAPDHADSFEEAAKEHQLLRLERYNHFPFLEEGNVFNRLLQDFLTSPGSTSVQIKEEWKRRVKQRDYL